MFLILTKNILQFCFFYVHNKSDNYSKEYLNFNNDEIQTDNYII